MLWVSWGYTTSSYIDGIADSKLVVNTYIHTLTSTNLVRFLHTRTELLSCAIDAYLRLGSDVEFLCDFLWRRLRDSQHFNQWLVLNQRPFGRGQSVQKVVLKFLHLPLIGGNFFQQLGALRLQFLQMQFSTLDRLWRCNYNWTISCGINSPLK